MSTKPSEFYPGLVFESEPCLLTEEMLSDFEMLWADNTLEDAADIPVSEVKIRSASIWQLCAIAKALVTKAAVTGPEVYGAPTLGDVSCKHPAQVGDTLRLKATVLEVKDPKELGAPCELWWRWQLFTEKGDEVLCLVALSSLKV